MLAGVVTPKSRIELLKREIEQLDKKLVESSTEAPQLQTLPMQLPKNIDSSQRSFRISQQREELVLQIQKLRSTTSGKESGLKKELEEAEAVYKTICERKVKEQSAADQLIDRLKAKAEALRLQLSDLEEKYENEKTKLSSMSKRREVEHSQRKTQFKNSLKPLEEAASKLYSEKQTLTTHRARLEVDLNTTADSILMVKEDIESHMMQRAEHIAHREEIEELYEEFKRQHEAEIAEYIAELEVKDQLGRLKYRREREIGLIKQSEGKVADIERLAAEAEAELQKTQTSIDNLLTASPNKRTEQDIEKLEGFLRSKCVELEIESFEDAIVETALRDGLDIDEEILRKQITEVDRREDVMTAAWNALEMELNEKAKKLTEELERIESSMFEDNYDKVATDKASREVRKKLIGVKEEITKERRKFYHNQSAISQWKIEVQTALIDTRPIKRLDHNDAKVIREFKARAYERITDTEQRVSLENLMNLYVAKINSRERYLQDSHSLIQQHKQRREQLKGQLKRLETEKNAYEDEKLQFKQTLMKLIMEEKGLLKSLERCKNIESEGENPLCHDLNRMTRDIEVREGLIAKVSVYIETVLKAQIKQLHDKSRRWTEELKGVKAALNELAPKEQEVHSEMESLLEKQRSVMLNSLEGLQRSQGAKPEDTALTTLKDEVMKKLGQFGAAEAELETAKSDAVGRVMLLSVKETEALNRISKVNDLLSTLEAEKSRIEKLEQKLADLDVESSQETRMRLRSVGRPYIRKSSVSPQPSQPDPDGPALEFNSTGLNAAPYLDYIEKAVGKQVQYVAEPPPAPNPKLSQRRYFKISTEETPFDKSFNKVSAT